jgi:hypothetical protein
MKKTIYLIAATLVLTLSALTSHAATITGDPFTKEAIAAMTPEQKQARVEEIKQRIEEIRAMDKSQLTKPERKELRAEVKSLKQESNDLGINKMYIYIAAIVALIIILLIIF